VYFAGDALNGRGSGTRDEWIAASYAAALMQQWGLEPVGDGGFVQEIPVTPDGKRITITKTWNAVGRLPGSDPVASREVILLSAHIDHLGVRPPRDGSASADTLYNGADDDASGCAAVLELARALATGPRPKRTIVFAFFGSEEFGGFGSRAFADRPPVPLTDIVANLQFEMIGRPDPKVPPHTLWLTGYERSTLGPALAEHGARLVQDPHPEQKFFVRSDNIQFARRGVIAHTVSSFGLHKEYHQPSDEVRAIDFPHMTESIQSMLSPIQWLANSGFKPEWNPGQKP
jgi:Zn-dependent M28 family amino/carboxypeptidase